MSEILSADQIQRAIERVVTASDDAYAATKGWNAHAATVGRAARAATTGDNSIAASLGQYSAAQAGIGGWIVLARYDMWGNIETIRARRVDGKRLKPHVYYRLSDRNRFVKAD